MSSVGEQIYARENLYNEHVPILPALLYKFCSPRPINEDLEVVAKMSLWKATSRYEPERGVKFSNYAYNCVWEDLKKELRDYSKLIKIPAWKQEENPTFEHEILFIDSLMDGGESLLISREEYDYILFFLNIIYDSVPKSHHNGVHWFLDHVLNEATIEEIANTAQVSKLAVIKKMSIVRNYLKKSKSIMDWANIQENSVNLTEQEKKIEVLFLEGKTRPEIANILGISLSAVKYHVTNTNRKVVRQPVENIKYTINQEAIQGFSERELDIVQILSEVQQQDEVAKLAKISKRTLGGHLNNIYKKLGVKNIKAALNILFMEGNKCG